MTASRARHNECQLGIGCPKAHAWYHARAVATVQWIEAEAGKPLTAA